MEAGNMVHFGVYDWRVLDVQDGRMLIITSTAVDLRTYHSTWSPITWETCGLRDYLNACFYNTFSRENQARVIETTNQNQPNQWLRTDGGRETRDRIFLLNLDEAVRYFGDSGQLEHKTPHSKFWINDQYNKARRLKLDAANTWWWLRSPGIQSNCAAFVGGGGAICLSGHRVVGNSGGVRPALWLRGD